MLSTTELIVIVAGKSSGQREMQLLSSRFAISMTLCYFNSSSTGQNDRHFGRRYYQMAGCWPSEKPLSESMMVNLLAHICVTRPQWLNWFPPTPAITSNAIILYISFQCQVYHNINTLGREQNFVYDICKCCDTNHRDYVSIPKPLRFGNWHVILSHTLYWV